MKQTKRSNGDLKPEHKKTTNRTTMGLTIDIDSRMKQIKEGAVI